LGSGRFFESLAEDNFDICGFPFAAAHAYRSDRFVAIRGASVNLSDRSESSTDAAGEWLSLARR
jgi:hypothetical protein